MPLFDSDAEALITFGETGITGSGSNKAAMLIAGVTPTNTGSFIKVSELGDARVTGSVGITESVPLTIGAFSTNVTGAVRIVQTNVTQSVTGSVFAFNNATQRLWTTGSVAVTSIASPVTVVQGASGSQFWKVSGSVQTIPSGIQQVTGTVEVASIASPIRQGPPGTIANSWYFTPTNGSNVIGNTQGTPLWISGSAFIFNNPDQRIWSTGSVALNGTLTPITTRIQGLNGNFASVDSAGRLTVSSVNSVFPSGSTPVSRSLRQDVSKTSDLVYTIPNGQVFHFLSLYAGAEGSGKKANVVELFFDPNGNGTGMELIRAVYCADNTFDFPINPDVFQYTGNGTRAIRLRLRRLDGGTREIFGSWLGYLE